MIKRVLLVGLAALLVPAAGWLSFPLWAGHLAANFLPAGWRLERLEVNRPGLAAISAPRLVLRGETAGRVIRLDITGTSFRYHDHYLDIDRLDARVGPGNMAPTRPGFPEGYAVPRLLFEAGFPPVHIRDLSLAVDGLLAEPLAIRDVELDPGTGATTHVRSHIEQIPFLERGGDFDLRLDARAIVFSLTADGETEPFLVFGQTQGEALSSELKVRLEPALLEAGLLASLLQPMPHDRLIEASGTMDVEIEFAGDGAQLPTEAQVKLRGLELDFEDVRYRADGALELALEAQKGDHSIVATVREGLALVLTFPHGGWPEWLTHPLEETGLSLTGLEVQLATARVNIPEDGKITLGMDQPGALMFEGDAVIEATHGPQMELLAVLNGATLSMGDFLQFAPVTLESGAQWEIRLDTPFNASLPELKLETGRLSSEGRGALHIMDGEWHSLSSEAFKLAFDAGRLSSDDPTDEILAGSGSLEAGLRFEAGGARLITTGKGQFQQVRAPGRGFTTTSVDLTWSDFDLASMTGRAGIQTGGLEVTTKDGVIHGIEVKANLRLSGSGRISGSGEGQFESHTHMPFNLNGNLERGVFDIELPVSTISATQVSNLLNPLGVTLPAGLGLFGGELDIAATLRYSDQLSGQFRVDGRMLELGLAESRLQELAFRSQIDAADFSVSGSADAGLAVLAADLDMLQPGWQFTFSESGGLGVNDFSAILWDGSLGIREMRWRNDALEPTVLDWQGFELWRLVAFTDMNGLSADGKLNARLPLRSKGNGIAIEKGSFEAVGPGRIAYTSGVVAGNVGLQALENFHYDMLKGTVNYDPEGPYEVRIEMHGRNPDLYGGHPVLFRLNLTGDLPELFRSLFLTGDFSESILERLRVEPGTLQ